MSTRNRRILLTGGTGQIGTQLRPLLESLGEVIAPTRSELDLTDFDAIRRFVSSTQPHWIVNTAAYTAVDKAETDVERTFATNAEALKMLAEQAAKLGSCILHLSTDYVFSGEGTRPWTETDAPAPLNVYGASKLAGEQHLAASGAAHLIFRTSWVYGATGNNFLRTILRLARERQEVRVVADQYGAPTWSFDVAQLVAHLVRHTERQAQGGSSLEAALRPWNGVYHACSSGFTTWFDFAEELVRLARIAEPRQAFAKILPIATAEHSATAARPLNSRLNCDKLARRLGFIMPSWQASAAEAMATLQTGPSH